MPLSCGFRTQRNRPSANPKEQKFVKPSDSSCSHPPGEACDSCTRIMGHQSPLPKHPRTNVRSVRSEEDGNDAHTKIQLLNGVTPTQFSGHPADFSFFRDQVRTHLESELLTDAQRVIYLPKFLTGEALEVVNRNRGCSYEELFKTLEERFGQAVQVF